MTLGSIRTARITKCTLAALGVVKPWHELRKRLSLPPCLYTDTVHGWCIRANAAAGVVHTARANVRGVDIEHRRELDAVLCIVVGTRAVAQQAGHVHDGVATCKVACRKAAELAARRVVLVGDFANGNAYTHAKHEARSTKHAPIRWLVVGLC